MKAVRGLPRLRVQIGGVPLAADHAHALRWVRVVQTLSAPAQCELVFQTPDARWADDGLVPGAQLRIDVDGHALAMFSGEVTAVEHAYAAARWQEIRVRAYDPLHRLQKRQTARAMIGLDAVALARSLLDAAGIAANVAAPEATMVAWSTLLQHDQTDFELLREACARSGLYFVLRDGTLHLVTLEGVRDAEPLTVSLGEELLEVRFELNAAPLCRRVVARGWDPGRARSVEGRAEAPRTRRSATARVALANLGGADERLVGGIAGAADAHAQSIAQAELDRAVASELTLRGTAQGNPALQPGSVVEVNGVADHLAGAYVVTEVVHTIDPELGYVAAMSSHPPPPLPRSVNTVVALGTVSAVDDPEALGRVRVRLPAFGDLETGWVQVLGLGAGAHKGLAIVPDLDDQVLVCLVGGELAQAVVLGGLYGDAHPDPGIEGDRVRRFSLLTAGGQQLVFDDHGRSVRIVGVDGSHLTLSPDGVALHANVPLTIEAPGQPLVFRASSIDFERR
jgi:phage baseplate assembly protein V